MFEPLRSLDEALALLPADSPFRTALTGLVLGDLESRRAGDDALRSLTRPWWEPPVAQGDDVALPVLRAVFDLPFGPPRDEWDRGAGEVVFALIGSATPEALDLVRERSTAAPPHLHLDLLTLVASAGTRQAAEIFAALVEAHGWPPRLSPRLFSELSRLGPHAAALFPAVMLADRFPFDSAGDWLLGLLRAGQLDAAWVADTPQIRGLPDRLRAQVDSLAAAGDDDEQRDGLISTSALLADLAGHLGDERVVPPLRAAADLAEAWPASFAVASLLRRGETVPDDAIARVAADPRARAPFYSLLRELGHQERIPAGLRTRDAFAEADMVTWLGYPMELGRPPDAIEKMAVIRGVGEDLTEVDLYVWRFRVGEDPWLAGVSGAYPTDDPEGPLAGSETFSTFAEWDAATAEEHASSVLETLTEWRRSWAAR